MNNTAKSIASIFWGALFTVSYAGIVWLFPPEFDNYRGRNLEVLVLSGAMLLITAIMFGYYGRNKFLVVRSYILGLLLAPVFLLLVVPLLSYFLRANF